MKKILLTGIIAVTFVTISHGSNGATKKTDTPVIVTPYHGSNG